MEVVSLAEDYIQRHCCVDNAMISDNHLEGVTECSELARGYLVEAREELAHDCGTYGSDFDVWSCDT